MSDIFAEAHRRTSASDPFSEKHSKDRTKAIIDARKAAETQAAKQRMAERAKPKFNDLPGYKFRDAFKLSGPS